MALPIFLRYSLIETLAYALERIIRSQPFPDLPVFPSHLVGTGNPFIENHTSAGDTLAGGVVANIILSLRTISEQNWSDFFEAASSLELILRKDPAGIYSLMDFKTRDLYRKEIESLSFASGQEENEIARVILDMARESNVEKPGSTGTNPGTSWDESPRTDPLPHIGEYLLGKDRLKLEHTIGYHPDIKTALKRWGAQHANALYLGSIFFLSLIILGLISRVINLPEFFLSGTPLLWITILALAFYC